MEPNIKESSNKINEILNKEFISEKKYEQKIKNGLNFLNVLDSLHKKKSLAYKLKSQELASGIIERDNFIKEVDKLITKLSASTENLQQGGKIHGLLKIFSEFPFLSLGDYLYLEKLKLINSKSDGSTRKIEEFPRIEELVDYAKKVNQIIQSIVFPFVYQRLVNVDYFNEAIQKEIQKKFTEIEKKKKEAFENIGIETFP